MSNDTEKVELLFKKNYGLPYAQPGVGLTSEGTSQSRPRIIPSLQILAQAIPPVAPTDISADSAFSLLGNGTRYTSSTATHIVKYEKLLLKQVKPLTTYWYTGATDATPEANRLSNAIPATYDGQTNTYGVSVYINVANSGDRSVAQTDADYPWLFDSDAGYLTFLKPVPTNTTVKMTFWRYEGTFGLGSTSGTVIDASGSSSLLGMYYNTSTSQLTRTQNIQFTPATSVLTVSGQINVISDINTSGYLKLNGGTSAVKFSTASGTGAYLIARGEASDNYYGLRVATTSDALSKKFDVGYYTGNVASAGNWNSKFYVDTDTGKSMITTNSNATNLTVKCTAAAGGPVEIYFDRTTVGGTTNATQKAAIGMDSVTTRNFFVWVNGSDRMNIDGSGNVGINTATPAYRLDVNGIFRVSTDQQVYPVWNGNTYCYLQAVSTDRVRIGAWDNLLGARKFTINEAGGNVGIGTIDPSANLHIHNSSTATLWLTNNYIGQNNSGAVSTEARIVLGSLYGGTPFYNSITTDVPAGNWGDSIKLNFNTVKGSNDNTQAPRLSIFGASQPTIVALVENGTAYGYGTILRFTGTQSSDSYQIEYNAAQTTSPNNLDIRMVGASDSNNNRFYDIGYYTSDNRFNAWNPKVKFNTYTGHVYMYGTNGLPYSANGVSGWAPRGTLMVGSSRQQNAAFASTTYLAWGGVNNGTITDQLNISVYGTDYFWAASYLTSSDRRIKKNITEINDGDALVKLRLIEPVEYDYIDTRKGTERVYGFIAQQVRANFQNATSINSEVIPSFYQLCDASFNGGTMVLTDISNREVLAAVEPNKTIVQIIDIAGKTHTPAVVAVDVSVGSITFDVSGVEIAKDVSGGKMFLYGIEVNDFHTLNKDYLFTINFAATQEIDRQVQALQARNDTLEARVSALEAENAELKRKLDAVLQHLGITV